MVFVIVDNLKVQHGKMVTRCLKSRKRYPGFLPTLIAQTQTLRSISTIWLKANAFAHAAKNEG
jgi:hypothetical protein